MTDTDKDRVDQLTSAPNAVPEDARPRIDVSEHGGVTRIDVREDSPVKPPSADGPDETADAGEADSPDTSGS